MNNINLNNEIKKGELIDIFANEMATLQKKADIYYYIDNNRDMSDYILIKASYLKDLISKLGICNEVYNKAYDIYDFRNSGKNDYQPSEEQLEKLKKERYLL